MFLQGAPICNDDLVGRCEDQVTEVVRTGNAEATELVDFWSSCLGPGHPLPDRTQFTPFALRRWLGWLTIYRVISDGTDFQVMLDGTEVVRMTGEDWTGRRISQADDAVGRCLRERLHRVRRNAMPLVQPMDLVQRKWRSVVRVHLPICRSNTPQAAHARANSDILADEVFVGLFVER